MSLNIIKRIPLLYLLFLSVHSGKAAAQAGFDEIYSFSPYPELSILSTVRSVLADSQDIFVAGISFKDSNILNFGHYTNRVAVLSSLDYSGNVQWQKILSFEPPFYEFTEPNLSHLIKKISPDKYVLGAQGWDCISTEYCVPRPFLYYFNEDGDSLDFVPLPINEDAMQEAYFAYSIILDRQKNVIVTGRYLNTTGPFDDRRDTAALWLAKVDPAGRQLWRKTILNPLGRGYSANAYKVINSNDSLHYLIGGGAAHDSPLQKTFFSVWKTDTAGNVVWQKNIPKATPYYDYESLLVNDQFFDIIPAANGSGYYFLAVDQKPVQFPGEPQSMLNLYYCGKLNEEGEVVWAKTYQHDTLHTERIFGLAQQANGDLLFMGSSGGGFGSQEAKKAQGPALFCTDSLGNLKWFKKTKRYNCPENVGQFMLSLSVNPYGGILRGGGVFQFIKQPGCYDTATELAWIMLTDSLGRRHPGDTLTYPMLVETVEYGDGSSFIQLPEGQRTAIHIYPNPVKEKIFVELLNSELRPAGLRMLLYDYTGRLLLQRRMTARREELDMGAYAPGIYFIRLRGQDEDLGGGKIIKR